MITKELLRAMRPELAKALEAVGQQFGIAFDVGTIRFDAKAGRATLSMSKKQVLATGNLTDGITTNPEADDLAPGKEQKAATDLQNSAIARLCDAESAWFGKSFTIRQSTFKVIGLLPSRPKFPILAKNVKTGKNFIFPVSMVRNHLAA